ncbi:MAG: hypothetical protein U0610_30870 [bacterium]
MIVAHLLAVAVWGGVVLAEVLLELVAADAAERALVARVHFWIDALVELPLLALIVATGAVLVARASALSSLLLVKIGCATVAIAFNLDCVRWVVRRFRTRADPHAVQRFTARIRYSIAGLPFGLVALLLGLARMRAG